MWAVGYKRAVDGFASGTLALHWDGTAWSIVRDAVTDDPEQYLAGVGGVAADDVWAVGADVGGSGLGTHSDPIVQHWNGRRWQVIDTPAGRIAGASIQGVAAIATDDVWAVGSSSIGTGYSDHLAMHWDGEAWTLQ